MREEYSKEKCYILFFAKKKEVRKEFLVNKGKDLSPNCRII